MDIRRADENTVVLEELDIFLCELLHQIAVCAEPGEDGSAYRRLYSSPTHGAEPGFDEEWKQYVEPELKQYFQSSLDVVQADLANFPVEGADEYRSFSIPVNHLESWIHALNQARLALGARYDVTEEDMDSMPSGAGARALAIFQIHFYGYLQECFLHELGG